MFREQEGMKYTAIQLLLNCDLRIRHFDVCIGSWKSPYIYGELFWKIRRKIGELLEDHPEKKYGILQTIGKTFSKFTYNFS